MNTAAIKTFLNSVNEKSRNTQKQKIYRFIIINPLCTISDISKSTGMNHSRVAARTSDLQDLGVVKVVEDVKINNNTYSKFRVVTDTDEQKRLFAERKRDKKRKAIKQLLNAHRSVLNSKTIYQLELEKALDN